MSGKRDKEAESIRLLREKAAGSRGSRILKMGEWV